MSSDRLIWDQLKSLTPVRFIRALEKDGWEEEEERRGATRAFVKHFGNGAGSPRRRRIVVHYHPGKTWGMRLLKGLISDTGWTPDDLKRLKLIKRIP